MGLVELVILGMIFGSIGVWIWSLVDMLGRSDLQWKAIGQDRTLWLLGILFVGLPVSIGYLLAMRPKLDRAKALGPVQFPRMLMAAAPGWYPDPSGAPMVRWFDGRQWTPQTAPMGAPPPGAVPPMGYPGAAPAAGYPGAAPAAGHPAAGAPPPPGYPPR